MQPFESLSKTVRNAIQVNEPVDWIGEALIKDDIILKNWFS